MHAGCSSNYAESHGGRAARLYVLLDTADQLKTSVLFWIAEPDFWHALLDVAQCWHEDGGCCPLGGSQTQGCRAARLFRWHHHFPIMNWTTVRAVSFVSTPRVVGLQGHSNYTNISHHAVGGCHGGDEGFQSGREPRHRQTWLRLFLAASTFPIMHCWSQSSQCRKSVSFVGYWATLGPPSETDRKNNN